MERNKIKKLYNLVQYYKSIDNVATRKIATLFWNLPYSLLKFKKRIEEVNNTNPKGTYFKIEPNIK